MECFPRIASGASPKFSSRASFEGEKIKVFSQKQGKQKPLPHTSMAVEMPGELTWAKSGQRQDQAGTSEDGCPEGSTRMGGPAQNRWGASEHMSASSATGPFVQPQACLRPICWLS